MTHASCALLFFVVLAALPESSFECATNGLCGNPGLCGSYQAAPAQPSCNSYSCRPSYSCGSYGCFRARARSAKTLEIRRFRSKSAALDEDRRVLQERLTNERVSDSVVDEHLERLSESAANLKRSSVGERVDPNRAFYECCLDRNLPDACLSKCQYGAFTKDALTRMYFKQDACPLEAMSELQFCAAQGRDHRACCARNGVSTTLAGEKCLLFCDQTPGRVTQLDLSYVPCFDRFESMKACFWHDIANYFRA